MGRHYLHTVPVPRALLITIESKSSASRAPAPTTTPPLHTRGTFISLENLERFSICCHAFVIHRNPANSRRLVQADAIHCSHCHRILDHETGFEVVNEYGEVIWPVPER